MIAGWGRIVSAKPRSALKTGQACLAPTPHNNAANARRGEACLARVLVSMSARSQSTLQRLFLRVVRKDPRDRIKGLIQALAPTARTPPAFTRDDAGSIVKLVKYGFLRSDDAIAVRGAHADEAAADLVAAGYSQASSQTAPRHAAVLLGVVEALNREDLDVFLADLAASAETLIASIATYPERLFDRAAGVRIFERRDWWNARFSEAGFEPQDAPREDFGRWTPFVFERRNAPPRAQPPPRKPEIVFVMPPYQNSFAGVTNALSQALTERGTPAAVVPPGHGLSDVRAAICWAHYWGAYRQTQAPPASRFDFFVTNFRLEPRGQLTEWLAELCERPTPKLAPSRFAADALVSLGVDPSRVHVIPHGYSPEFAAEVSPLPLATQKRFRFLTVMNSYDPERFGFDLLLEAYRRAFTFDDDVCLVVKDYDGTSNVVRAAIEKGSGPEILFYANFVSKRRLASMYASCSAFVAPFRGEGFGMKILDAAALGLPLILPVFGGPADFCPPDYVRPLRFRTVAVGDCLESRELDWREQRTWCEPDIDDLASAMREVYEDYDPARRRAARLRESVLEGFSWDRAAQKLIQAVES